MIKKPLGLLLVSALNWGFLLVLLITTDPRNMQLPLVVLPFILLFTGITAGLYAIMKWRKRQGRKYLILAVTVAFVPTMLLILQSIGQLTSRDFLIVLALLLISSSYLTRLNLSASP